MRRSLTGAVVFWAALSLAHAALAQAPASSQQQATPAPAAPAKPEKGITLGALKSPLLWPIWAAQDRGFFAREGLAVKTAYSANAPAEMMGLIRGELDMATAPLDSVIAYSEGEGAPQAPKDADLVALFGVNNGALSLVSQPEILGGIQLHYKTIAVDETGSAISFVVRELLAQWQYPPNGYKTIAVGDAPARWGALREKRAAATVLTPPFTQLALAQGYTPLLNVADRLRGYQGTVAASRRDWATSNADTATGFVRGYRSGLDWLKMPANRSAALDILRREMPELTVASAVENYGLLIVDSKGFDPGGAIDPVGARTVFHLRRLYGPQGKGIPEVGYFIDASYFQRAIRR